MKRYFLLLLVLLTAWNVFAGGGCDRDFEYAIQLFNEHNYRMAKKEFEWCRKHCGDRSESTYQGWIDKCNARIREEEKAAERARQAKAEAIRRQEAAAIEKAERVKRNRYIFLTSSSPVLGDFSKYGIQGNLSSVAPNLKFTTDPSEAYYAVRVLINISESPSTNSGYRRYCVEADVEIEDLTTGAIQLLSPVRVEDACTTTVDEAQAEECVANKIYSRDEFFQQIADGISSHINNQPSRITVNSNTNGKKEKKVVVRVNYVGAAQSGIESALNTLGSTMETALSGHIDAEGNKYIVLDHSQITNELIRDEIIYSERNVSAAEIAQACSQDGSDLACYIFVTRSNNNDLFFECKIVDIQSARIIKKSQFESCEYSHNKPLSIGALNIASAVHVANHLAKDLGVSNISVDGADSEVKVKVGKQNAARTATAFVPFGIYQLCYKDNKTSGYLFMAGEVVCIGGAVYAQYMRQGYIKKMNSTTSASQKKAYADKANMFTTVRNVSIGAAVAVYVCNVVDAFVDIHKHNKSLVLNPVVTEDGCAALTLSYNF